MRQRYQAKNKDFLILPCLWAPLTKGPYRCTLHLDFPPHGSVENQNVELEEAVTSESNFEVESEVGSVEHVELDTDIV